MIKDRTMYTVLFPNGKTLTLSSKTLADVYCSAYLGKIIDTVVEN